MALNPNFLQEVFLKNSFSLDEKQVSCFCKYAQLLVEWNQKMNLTAITDDEGIAYKHFVDSLVPLSLLGSDAFSGKHLIDVGTGAGFPGLPLKIACPEMELTMVDSLKKRVGFLKEVCSQLSLQADVFHLRAEEAAHLRELSEYCLPFVRVGGYFLAFKAGEIEQELDESRNAIGMLGGKVERIIPYEVPHTGRRTLLVIKKISQTLPKYPRNPAKIAKTPLK